MRGETYKLAGQKFGRLTATDRASNRKHSTRWNCICDCGNLCVVRTWCLTSGVTQSCGCIASELLQARNFKHGLSFRGQVTPEYKLLHKARGRAKKKKWSFDITIEDANIPELCPVLGLRLQAGVGKRTDNSPTLDRVDNTKGYVKGNVKVIGDRANRIKNDATSAELIAVADYIRRNLGTI